MSICLRHLSGLLLLLLTGSQSLASDAYVGLRGGVLLTSPGTYADTVAAGLIGGYALPGCCWALEADWYGSLGNGMWQGQGMAFSTVYRLARIGDDNFIFSPKFKLGLVQTRYTLSGNTQSTSDLNWGIGMLIGDDNDLFEFEVSGSLSKLGGSDEVMFFTINYIKPL